MVWDEGQAELILGFWTKNKLTMFGGNIYSEPPPHLKLLKILPMIRTFPIRYRAATVKAIFPAI